MSNYLSPRSSIGIIGTNEQAYQLALAAKKLGYRVNVLGTSMFNLVKAEADQYFIVESMQDQRAFKKLAQVSDVVLYTNENFPNQFIKLMNQFAHVPQSENMHFFTTDRSVQNVMLEGSGLDLYPYVLAVTVEDVRDALSSFGSSCTIRTTLSATHKPAIEINSEEDLSQAEALLGYGPCIVEPIQERVRRIVITTIKDEAGEFSHFPISAISIDDETKGFVSAPAQLEEATAHLMEQATEGIGRMNDFVGLFSVEYALTEDDTFYIKEITNYPHKALDHTLKSHTFSTYEAMIRLAVGLPLNQLNHPTANLIYWRFNEKQLGMVEEKLLNNTSTDVVFYPNYLDERNDPYDTIGHVFMHQTAKATSSKQSNQDKPEERADQSEE